MIDKEIYEKLRTALERLFSENLLLASLKEISSPTHKEMGRYVQELFKEIGIMETF